MPHGRSRLPLAIRGGGLPPARRPKGTKRGKEVTVMDFETVEQLPRNEAEQVLDKFLATGSKYAKVTGLAHTEKGEPRDSAIRNAIKTDDYKDKVDYERRIDNGVKETYLKRLSNGAEQEDEDIE